MLIIENSQGGWDNELPDAYQRARSPYWRLMGGLLGLPAEKTALVDDMDGVSPAVAQIRAYEERRLAPAPTVAELASEVVEHAREAVKTKTERAKEWLAQRLKDGPVEQKTVEADGQIAGFGLKILKEAKKRLRVGSLRRGHSWRWVLPMASKEANPE
jgi:hypothetical protein